MSGAELVVDEALRLALEDNDATYDALVRFLGSEDRLLALSEVGPTTITCGKHREAFRAHWPTGFIAFCGELLRRMPDSLRPFRESLLAIPACCRLPVRELLEVYSVIQSSFLSDVRLWRTRRCVRCGRLELSCEVLGARHKGSQPRLVPMGLRCLGALVDESALPELAAPEGNARRRPGRRAPRRARR